MILEKAGPTNSQGWLNTVIRRPEERTNSLTTNAKRSTVGGRRLQSSHSPLWPEKSQSWENTNWSEHLLWPSWWTKGLLRTAALLKTQLGSQWAGLWEKTRHRDAEVWNNFVDRWVQHKGKRRNRFLAQACGSPSKFKLKSAGPAASTRRSWGRPDNALHC